MPLSWTESAYRSGGLLRVLYPPYTTTRLIDWGAGGIEPPPGAIVFGQEENPLAVLAELTLAIYRWPWVIPCITIQLDQGVLEPLLLLVSELRDRLAVAKQTRRGASGDISLILAAVRHRKPPDADVLATWAGRRLNNPALRDAVASQFHEALGGPAASTTASVSTYSRLFARFGPYTARDWRAIARLCAHCAAIGSPGATGALPIRSASYYLKRYVHLPNHTLADRAGWEWALEGALRAGGYAGPRP